MKIHERLIVLPALTWAALGIGAISPAAESTSAATERWGVVELALRGPDAGNPFVDVSLEADFAQGDRRLTVPGFYDGEGRYLVRFMPPTEGHWDYVTRSNRDVLDGQRGRVDVAAPSPGNHGPVRVSGRFHFAYADETPYYPVGTTAYAWIHMPESLQEQTLRTLRDAPFNKMRMLVLPKRYAYNEVEPTLFPFPKDAAGEWDTSRFDLAFFRHLERRVLDLQSLGIEADLILFHPYDRGHWGFDRLPADVNERYLRYLIARLGAYRNVWWSMANEYDLARTKTLDDWNRYLDIVAEDDVHRHLCSIHNGDVKALFDHRRDPITHVSVQHYDTGLIEQWREEYGKPVIDDEPEYEGNLEEPWGSISARELVHRIWLGTMKGGYVGHGETYQHPEDVIWWAKGGVLRGDSPSRIAFLRGLLEAGGPLEPLPPLWMWERTPAAHQGDGFLIYFGPHQPARFSRWTLRVLERLAEVPEGTRWRFELIDTWAMTVSPVPGTFGGDFRLDLPGRTGLALRATPVAAE